MKRLLFVVLILVSCSFANRGDSVGVVQFSYGETSVDADLSGVSTADEAQTILSDALSEFLDTLVWKWEMTAVAVMQPGSIHIYGEDVGDLDAVEVVIEELLVNFFGRSFGGATFKIEEGAIVIELSP